MNYKTTITVDGVTYDTLQDILPEVGKQLKVLIIGKTPSLNSVLKGHYFQGTRGKTFWRKLNALGLLKYPLDEYADDYLLEQGFGVTHISKIPREYKPLNAVECRKGYIRLMEKIELYKPKLLIFTYKNALDSLMSAVLNESIRAKYGFNPSFDEILHSAVFVYPMPGTICTKAEAEVCFKDLVSYMKGL